MKPSGIAVILLYTVCLLFGLTVPVQAGDVAGEPADVFGKILNGGLLYDNWYATLGVNIETTHPSYPEAGKKKGAATWRCKECHGWDYLGKDGTYSQGSHYSGIGGIREYAGLSPDEIKAVLKDPVHTLEGKMPEDAYDNLAYFVAYGQVDMDKYIDRATKKVTGDMNRGAKIYGSTCAKCHGDDGRTINFKTSQKPEYLGTLASGNPWETLHKIRYGQPRETMTSLLYLPLKDQIDVLAYCQSLPVM